MNGTRDDEHSMTRRGFGRLVLIGSGWSAFGCGGESGSNDDGDTGTAADGDTTSGGASTGADDGASIGSDASGGDSGSIDDSEDDGSSTGSDVDPGCDDGSGEDPPRGRSVLAMLAASMPPGSWALVTPDNDQNEILGGGAHSGSMLHFSNNCAWNPRNRCIEMIGADHNWGTSMKYVRYREATNRFELVNSGGDSSDSGSGPGHGFDHFAVNPTSGEGYSVHYSGAAVSPIHVTRAPLDACMFSDAVPDTEVTTTNITFATCWWSGTFVGAGAEGCLMIFNAGNSMPGGSTDDGQILAFDPQANAWIHDAVGMAPQYGAGGGGTYHEVAAYSPCKNVMVYGGGNAAPSKLWRLDQDGNAVAMPDVPGNASVGVQRGLLVEEPVTGNFLLLSNGELWELDPDGPGTWTQQTDARIPPPEVGIPGPDPNIDGMQCCAIPQLGIVAFIKQTSQSDGVFHIYKHA